jgi:hypothetical protein
VISHRPQPHQHRRAQNVRERELIHLAPLHRGLYHLPHHKHHRCRPDTSICTFAPPVMLRSCPWRNSNIILSPITKRAGSPSNTASNDVFLTSFFSFLGLSPSFPSPAHLLPAPHSRHLLPGAHRPASGTYPIFPSCMSQNSSSPSSPSILEDPGIYHHIDTTSSAL